MQPAQQPASKRLMVINPLMYGLVLSRACRCQLQADEELPEDEEMLLPLLPLSRAPSSNGPALVSSRVQVPAAG